jgi:hypothetical protein
MSAPSAIAAVTQTLAGLLETALQLEDPSYRVTSLPLDKSNAEVQLANRLNLFLIQPSHNAALRNTNSVHARVHGDASAPPLAINLTYMITTYGEATPDAKDQRILGLAMQFLNDNPVLRRDDIRNAFPGTGLEDQFERVRITPRDVSLEDMSRMWSTFMTQYRTSAAYDVSVVLIDNLRPAPGGLPVVRRGEEDAGVLAEAGLPPVLTSARPPALLRRGGQVTYQPAIRLGEILTLEGERLPYDGVVLQVRSPAWEPRFAEIGGLLPAPGPRTLQVMLPDPPPESAPPPGPPLEWAPGVYTATLSAQAPGRPDVPSNSVPFALAPRVTVNPNNAAPGDVQVTVDCLPAPRDGQVVLLMMSRRAPIAPTLVTPPAGPGQPAPITFLAEDLTPGEYLVRLRIDGVDSLPFRAVALPSGEQALEYSPAERILVA